MTEREPTPAEILLNVLVTLLAPMFIAVCQGNVQAARLVAHATIRDYCAENNADLITVAKIIALGLATISALSLAMTEGIGLPMFVRLQSSANACDRAEHRNRRVLKESLRAPPRPEPPEVDEADVIARAEAAAALARQAQQQPKREPPPEPQPAPQPTVQQPPEPTVQQSAAPHAQPTAPHAQPTAAKPAPAQQPVPAAPMQDINRATWATAFATVAQEFAAEMPNLPPEEKWAASMRSKALSSVAADLLNGMQLEPYRLRPSTA